MAGSVLGKELFRTVRAEDEVRLVARVYRMRGQRRGRSSGSVYSRALSYVSGYN